MVQGTGAMVSQDIRVRQELTDKQSKTSEEPEPIEQPSLLLSANLRWADATLPWLWWLWPLALCPPSLRPLCWAPGVSESWDLSTLDELLLSRVNLDKMRMTSSRGFSRALAGCILSTWLYFPYFQFKEFTCSWQEMLKPFHQTSLNSFRTPESSLLQQKYRCKSHLMWRAPGVCIRACIIEGWLQTLLWHQMYLPTDTYDSVTQDPEIDVDMWVRQMTCLPYV